MSRRGTRGFPRSLFQLTSVLILAAFVFLTACNSSSQGAAATSTPTSAATSTAAVTTIFPATACTGSYTSSAYHYTITCPTGWSVESTTYVPNAILFGSVDQSSGLIISTPNTPIASNQFVSALQTFLNTIGATNTKVTPSDQMVTAGAYTWTLTATATFTKNGTDYTTNQYVLNQGGKQYVVQAFAPTATFTAQQAELQAALASLKLS